MATNNTKILVVDDEESIRKLLATRFAREGWTVEQAEDGEQALTMATKGDFHVVVTDIKMPNRDGFQLIEGLHEASVRCPVVMITGHGEKECAIEAIHKGAFDYLEKPFHMDEIAQVVKRAVGHENLRRENDSLVKKLAEQLEVKSELLERVENKKDSELLLGKSEHIQNLREMVRSVADGFRGQNDPVVLVTGESGTGKEVIARYFHQEVFGKESGRRPFVAINCAAFPDNLLESELFGYEKGAFTGAMSRKLGLFELASSGTLFLDEIGEMDLRMQAKLLRVLQERVVRRLGGTADISVRPHIIAATNRDLLQCTQKGTFREDLYYRLNTIPIFVAPLRSRSEDIELLANSFLREMSQGRGKKFTGFTANATKAMLSYRWPGNVRELRSVVERAVILEKGPQLELSQLRQEHLKIARTETVSHPSPSTTTTSVTGIPQDLVGKGMSEIRKEMDDRLARQLLTSSLERFEGNVSQVARDLRLDRANLLRMLKRYGISADDYRPFTPSDEGAEDEDSTRKAG